MNPVPTRYARLVRTCMAGLGLWIFASSAQAGLQPSLEDLKSLFFKASEETNANLEKAKALEDKGDRAAYCSALKVTLISLTRKVDLLHQINAVFQNEPGASPENKKFMADEEMTVREGQVGLQDFIKSNCDQDYELADFIDATMVQVRAVDDSGKAHLKDGLALIQAGDKPKGCEHMLAALKDYETQLDLTRKLQDELGKDKRTPPDIAVRLQYSVGKLEGDIKDIKSFIEVTCPAN